jgi:cytochrome o ubiquinol oxidase subunit II
MDKKQLLAFLIPASLVIFLILAFALGNGIAVLNPKGYIAVQERELMRIAAFLALLIVTPVISLIIFVAYKYRETNQKTEYTPDSGLKLSRQLIWWSIPTAIILVMAAITWNKTHLLDPFKPINSTIAPIKIQVISLRWKWLFIYPDQNIATVNFIQIPVNTPVDFELTSDAPMNSFWIPQLDGQIYSMTGMSTQTHLIASVLGDYRGSAAEINGRGFSGMNFIVRVSSKSDFDSWVYSVKKSGKVLDQNAYNNLSKPSENNPATFYSSASDNLYNTIILKYLVPKGETIKNIKGIKF